MSNPTNQEIFDTVVKHLRSQGCKSIDPETGNCLYRGPNGKKCAAGCLIPDDKYEESMEGRHVYNLKVFKDMRIQMTMLVAALQIIHDHNDIQEWEERFQETAESRELTYSPPQD